MIVERMKGEPEIAWEVFRFYISIPVQERSIETIAARLAKPDLQPARIARWASRFNWNARALDLARQTQEMETIQRTRALERQADEYRVSMLTPYLRAVDRYEKLVESGEDIDTNAFIDTMAQLFAAAPLAEEALLLSDQKDVAELALKYRTGREAAWRSSLMAGLARGPALGPDLN